MDTSTWKTVYTPVHGYVGTDTFDFVACDGLATSQAAANAVAATIIQ